MADYEFRTYDQMEQMARTMHPDAKPVLNNGQWEIHLKTNYLESMELPDRLKDTPGGRYWEEESYQFERWSDKNMPGDTSLVQTVEYLNLLEHGEKLIIQAMRDILAEEGLPETYLHPSVREEEVLRKWQQVRTEATQRVASVRKEAEDAYYARWSQ